MKPSLAAIAAVRPPSRRKSAKPSRDDIVRRAQLLQSEFNTVAAIEFLKAHDIEVDVIQSALLPAGAD